jgi:hypothetical protein
MPSENPPLNPTSLVPALSGTSCIPTFATFAASANAPADITPSTLTTSPSSIAIDLQHM